MSTFDILPSNAVEISGSRTFTTSMMVAEVFGKQHKHVLRDIDALDCSPEFHRSNFGPMVREELIGSGATREFRAFEISKDGFTFLAMGYTGAKAAQFKEAYIRRFNDMEARLSAPQPEAPAIPIRAPADPYVLSLTFEAARVRVVVEGGEPFFVANDVSEALGYQDASKVKRLHGQGARRYSYLPSPNGRYARMRVLSEAEVLRLAFGCNLSSAIRFQNWLCEMVLPVFHKSGWYGVQSRPNAGESSIGSKLAKLGALIESLENEGFDVRRLVG